MPQLLFHLQRVCNTSTDGPFLETLVQLLNQHKVTYDGIQKHDDAVSVDFSSPEDAKNAFKAFDGMELMGSYMTVKLGRNVPNGSNHRSQYSRRHHYSEEYPDEDEGYHQQDRFEQRSFNGRHNQRYNGNQYENGRGSMHSAKVEQYPCRILIPSDMVKVVLGKGGATITAIQNKTDTKIDIHRDKGAARGRIYEDTLTSIRGEPTAFSDVIKEILLVMQDEYEKRDKEDCKPLQLKLLAHDLLCGRIIGKAGSNLKHVRQESGVTKLIISNSIFEDGSHFSARGIFCTGERVVTVEGSVDAICTAEQILSKKLRDYMERDLKNTGNTFGGSAMGGYYGMDQGYQTYQQQMAYSRAQPPYTYPSHMPFMGYQGYPAYMGMGYPGILGHGYPPYAANLAPQPQSGGNEKEISCIIIPTKEVGAVIGRSGEHISRVKGYSGATVKVVKGEEGGESRVEITGPADAQWRASLCVFNKIKETMKMTYSDAQLKTEYMVPSSCVGRIIGKKGQVVQDIQDKAQADIEVPKDKQGGEDVPVFITGTFNGTQIALNCIRDIVHRAQNLST